MATLCCRQRSSLPLLSKAFGIPKEGRGGGGREGGKEGGRGVGEIGGGGRQRDRQKHTDSDR